MEPFPISRALSRQPRTGGGKMVYEEGEIVSAQTEDKPSRFAEFNKLQSAARTLKITLPREYTERFLQLHTKDHTTFTQLENDELDQILSALRQNVESPDTVESPVASAEAVEPVPEHLQELQSIVASPITVAEVPNWQTFMLNRYSRIANALLTAGYDALTVDRKMADSFINTQAGQTPEEFVTYINGSLQKLWKETLLDQPSSERTIPAPKVSTPLEISPTAESTTGETEPDKTVLQPIVPIKPVLDPKRYQLTPKMRVDTVSEAVVKEPEKTIESPEGLGVSQEYQQKLDDINTQPFQRDSYLEYVFDLHSELNQRYSAVVALGRANLKRFDGTYVPSEDEKKALQFLSSLQGQYAKMQRADSEIGIRRAELMHSLNSADGHTDEAAIKAFTQQYLDGIKKLFANITKLEGLVAVAMREEKASVTDTYREQLQQLYKEGQQVLLHLPPEHLHKDEFTELIKQDMSQAVAAASPDPEGDRALRERAPYFTGTRDRVKTAIDFVKIEAEFEEQRARVMRELSSLQSAFDRLKILPTSLDEIKHDFEKTLGDISALLSSPEVLPINTAFHYVAPDVFIEATERLSVQMGSLTQKVILARQYVGWLEEAAGTTGSKAADTAEYGPVREETTQLTPQLERLVLGQQYRVEQVRASVPAEVVAPSLIKRLLSRFRPRKVGMAASVALFSAAMPTATDVNTVQALSPEATSYTAGVGEVAGVATNAVVDAAAILAYLRSTESSQATVAPELLKPQQIDDVGPKQNTNLNEVEIVPGVIFPNDEQPVNADLHESVSGLSDMADPVAIDPGIDLTPQVDESVPDQKLTLTWGDTFWDINEGQSIAGKLPVMSEINPYFKQSLIAEMRSRLAKDPEMRKIIGGMGDTADIIYAGQVMNITELNKFARIVAVEKGYLQ